MKIAIFNCNTKLNHNTIKDFTFFLRINNIEYNIYVDNYKSKSIKKNFFTSLRFIYILGCFGTLKLIASHLFMFYKPSLQFINDVNSKEFIRHLKDTGYTHGISLSFGQIFKKDIINYFNGNLVNIHSSILPRDKGLMPNFWCLYNNYNFSGVTLHRIDTNIDTGVIINQITYPISCHYSYLDLITISRYITKYLLFNYINSFIEHDVEVSNSYNTFPSFVDISKIK